MNGRRDRGEGRKGERGGESRVTNERGGVEEAANDWKRGMMEDGQAIEGRGGEGWR